jgi:hypothetical protein
MYQVLVLDRFDDFVSGSNVCYMILASNSVFYLSILQAIAPVREVVAQAFCSLLFKMEGIDNGPSIVELCLAKIIQLLEINLTEVFSLCLLFKVIL